MKPQSGALRAVSKVAKKSTIHKIDSRSPVIADFDHSQSGSSVKKFLALHVISPAPVNWTGSGSISSPSRAIETSPKCAPTLTPLRLLSVALLLLEYLYRRDQSITHIVPCIPLSCSCDQIHPFLCTVFKQTYSSSCLFTTSVSFPR